MTVSELLDTNFFQRVLIKLTRYVKENAVGEISEDYIRGLISPVVVRKAMKEVIKDDERLFLLWKDNKEFQNELTEYIYECIKGRQNG